MKTKYDQKLRIGISVCPRIWFPVYPVRRNSSVVGFTILFQIIGWTAEEYVGLRLFPFPFRPSDPESLFGVGGRVSSRPRSPCPRSSRHQSNPAVTHVSRAPHTKHVFDSIVLITTPYSTGLVRLSE